MFWCGILFIIANLNQYLWIFRDVLPLPMTLPKNPIKEGENKNIRSQEIKVKIGMSILVRARVRDFFTVLKTNWLPLAVIWSLVGLLSFWHTPNFHSQFYTNFYYAFCSVIWTECFLLLYVLRWHKFERPVWLTTQYTYYFKGLY